MVRITMTEGEYGLFLKSLDRIERAREVAVNEAGANGCSIEPAAFGIISARVRVMRDRLETSDVHIDEPEKVEHWRNI